jgi:hypothetical protein
VHKLWTSLELSTKEVPLWIAVDKYPELSTGNLELSTLLSTGTVRPLRYSLLFSTVSTSPTIETLNFLTLKKFPHPYRQKEGQHENPPS